MRPILIIFVSSVISPIWGSLFFKEVRVFSDGPVLRGGKISFRAEVMDGDTPVSGKLGYEWHDNTQEMHRRSNTNVSSTDIFEVVYNVTSPGTYRMFVRVSEYYVLPIPIANGELIFNITEELTGDVNIHQSGRQIESNLVSSADPAILSLPLSPANVDYINSTATSVAAYWFIDCELYATTNNMSVNVNFNEPNKEHDLDVILHVGYEPPPTPSPPTTSTTSATITPAPTTMKPTTVKTPSTSIKPGKISASAIPNSGVPVADSKHIDEGRASAPNKIESPIITPSISRSRRSPGEEDGKWETLILGNTVSQLNQNKSALLLPQNCYHKIGKGSNSTTTKVRRSADYNPETIGYFSRKILVKEPVRNITVSGSNWLRGGDLLSLRVTCSGSYYFNYCTHYYMGEYNVTGNESCITSDTSEKCDFTIQRYLGLPGKHTAVIIIFNDLNTKVYPVTVTVYKENSQPQLSVIIVPVTFSLVAIVLIIFGIAYYFQNRSRFVVEVANFNFAEQYNDMEYMSLMERLKDAFANAFSRSTSLSTGSSDGDLWQNKRKYGSMT